ADIPCELELVARERAAVRHGEVHAIHGQALDESDLVAVDFDVREINGALTHRMVVARLARERVAGLLELVDILLHPDRRIELRGPLSNEVSGARRQSGRNEQSKKSEETRFHEASVSKLFTSVLDLPRARLSKSAVGLRASLGDDSAEGRVYTASATRLRPTPFD